MKVKVENNSFFLCDVSHNIFMENQLHQVNYTRYEFESKL